MIYKTKEQSTGSCVTSQNISVFPIAKHRINSKLDNRLIYESHLANITNNIVDKNYVVEYNKRVETTLGNGSTLITGDYIILNVDGYSIRIDNLKDTIDSIYKDFKQSVKVGDKISCKLNFDLAHEKDFNVNDDGGNNGACWMRRNDRRRNGKGNRFHCRRKRL